MDSGSTPGWELRSYKPWGTAERNKTLPTSCVLGQHYHPDLGGAAQPAVLGEHPAVVGQQHLQGVTHGDDEGHPEPRAEDDAAHHLLGLAGHAATAETRPDKPRVHQRRKPRALAPRDATCSQAGRPPGATAEATDPRPDQREGATRVNLILPRLSHLSSGCEMNQPHLLCWSSKQTQANGHNQGKQTASSRSRQDEKVTGEALAGSQRELRPRLTTDLRSPRLGAGCNSLPSIPATQDVFPLNIPLHFIMTHKECRSLDKTITSTVYIKRAWFWSM